MPDHPIYAPILTPFDASGAALDDTAFTRHLTYLKDAGLTGVLVLGTNGEFAQLSYSEKFRLIALALKHEDLQIIVGCTVPDSQEETLALCATLNGQGRNLAGLLVAPPYFKNYRAGDTVSDATVAEFYRRLAMVVTDVPLYLYNVPQGSKQLTAAISPAIIDLLGDARITGIKDSTGVVGNVPAYLAVRPELNILIGNDHAISAGLGAGAKGSITACANVFPSAVRMLYEHVFTPHELQAQAELSALRGVLELLPGKLIAVQKIILHILGVVEQCAPVRVPGGTLTDQDKNEILDQLEAVGPRLEINSELGARLTQKIADYR